MKAKPFIQNSLQLDPDANQNLKSAIWIRLSERLLSCHLTYFALPDRVALAHKETVHLFKCKFSLHVQPPEQIENLVRKQYDEKNFSRIKKADGGEKIKILNNFFIKILKKICQFVFCTNPPPPKKKIWVHYYFISFRELYSISFRELFIFQLSAYLEKTPGWVSGSSTLGWEALYCMWLAISRAKPEQLWRESTFYFAKYSLL